MEVEIDDVAHFLATTVNHPVMAVKGCSSSSNLPEPGQGAASTKWHDKILVLSHSIWTSTPLYALLACHNAKAPMKGEIT
jgi:hypothetical protein